MSRTVFDSNVLVYHFDDGSPANAVRLVTEDLQHGQVIDGLRIENPFLGWMIAR